MMMSKKCLTGIEACFLVSETGSPGSLKSFITVTIKTKADAERLLYQNINSMA